MYFAGERRARCAVTEITDHEDIAVSILPRLRRLASALQGPVFVALLYYLGAQAAFQIGTLSDNVFALFWPPNVVLFCALLVAPSQVWWLYILLAVPAHIAAELSVGMSTAQTLAAFVTNSTLALASAYTTRRFLGESRWFGSVHRASVYIAITAVVVPAAVGFAGACVPILGGGSSRLYWTYYAHWVLSNALPNLTLGPVFLIWFSGGARWLRRLRLRRHLEPVALAFALVSICVAAADLMNHLIASSFVPALLLLPLPFVLWATVRYGERGASGALLVVTVLLTWHTLHYPNQFSGRNPDIDVLGYQLFLAGLAIPMLLLGALMEELRRANHTTRQLATSLLRAQDDERRSIARDLHDITGQHLIAATLISGQLQNVLPVSSEPALRQLEEMLQQSIQEIRTVSYLLHPPLLDEEGLGLALRHFVDGFVKRSRIAVELDVEHGIGRLGHDIELVLFRVVQEALTNVARHSGSPTAGIRLARAGNRQSVSLTIEDSGRGMPGATAGSLPLLGTALSRVAEGVGLSSMRERLKQVGGQMEIVSSAAGTVVRASVPIGERAGED